MRSRWPLFATVAALVAASLALAALRSGADEPDEAAVPAVVVEEHVIIELRVWQHLDNSEDVRLSARERGGEWVKLTKYQTIPFALYKDAGGVYRASWERHAGRHGYRDLSLAGVDLRFWQRHRAPELIYVRACPVPCPQLDAPVRGQRAVPYWAPLGMVRVPLDDGFGPLGLYRHGALTLAVPVANPGLRRDREYLLALRDTLAGTAELNWSASTPTGAWEGVTLSGSLPRVTGLDLADRELDGVVLGWLGNLTRLRELRLDGNRLTGTLPAKLAALTQLTYVSLAGNDFGDCAPPALRSVARNDLALLRLPDCDPPAVLLGSTTHRDLVYQLRMHPDRSPFASGTYRWASDRGVDYVIEIPTPSPSFRIHVGGLQQLWPEYIDYSPDGCRYPSPCAILLQFLPEDPIPSERFFIALDILTGQVLLLSRYLEDDAEISAFLERIAASVGVYRFPGDDGQGLRP